MNSLIITNKTRNLTGQKNLSFGTKQLKTLEQFKTPSEILKYARRLTDQRERYINSKNLSIKSIINNNKKPNKGEQLLSDAFEKAINVDERNKNKEHIFDTAKNLLAYYMIENPSKFLAKAEEIGGKLNNSIGEVGLKLKKELVNCFPSIMMTMGITTKKPARACVDHIINNTTYKRLNNHIDIIKGKNATDNFEFLD